MLILTQTPFAAFVELADEHLGWMLLALIAVVWIVFGTTASMSKRRAIERTRRELAAYVAEGSICPDDAERLIRAGGYPSNDD
jgi:hypothetical protein